MLHDFMEKCTDAHISAPLHPPCTAERMEKRPGKPPKRTKQEILIRSTKPAPTRRKSKGPA